MYNDFQQHLQNELQAIREAGLYKEERVITSAQQAAIKVAPGTDVLNFCANNYLGLANNPELIKAAKEALDTHGYGMASVRFICGTGDLQKKLEAKISEFFGTEDTILYTSCFDANGGVFEPLLDEKDAIISDALNHASIIDGCRLSGADVLVYRHRDLDDLTRKLAACREHRRRLVVSDAVFSMDGDILDLPRFLEICRRHDAFSMIDEAHATGVLGATGRGLAEHFGCDHADITLGTLSKALGSSGGFVCGSQTLIDYLTNKSRSFIFSTALGAANLAAADTALTILEQEPDRVARLRQNATFFVDELARYGIRTTTESAIVPIIIGDERQAVAVSTILKDKGFLISAIRYPTVAKGAARLRVALSSEHSRESLAAAAQAIAQSV